MAYAVPCRGSNTPGELVGQRSATCRECGQAIPVLAATTSTVAPHDRPVHEDDDSVEA